jgi:hypothetical protein
MIPAEKDHGRDGINLKKREKIRRELNRMAMFERLPNGVRQIIMSDGIRSLRTQPANPKPPDDA